MYLKVMNDEVYVSLTNEICCSIELESFFFEFSDKQTWLLIAKH